MFINGQKNWLTTRDDVGWKPLAETNPDTYKAIGFKCGLEVHQQLATKKKLFCRCPAGIYHDFEDYDAEIVRHMRPTLSELGEYDGTALMEFKTRKNIYYRIKNDTACTYEIDDTPPFLLNPEALEKAMRIAVLLKMNIVGELHITRKQYLDGSIPTGFQRTTILGIEGEIPISNKKIRIIQFSIEEDSCREVSDYRHQRVYFADRLGMPLIETVTYPEMLTPSEAAEACNYIRFLARTSGSARTGIGAARQDVNVSVTGGTRVEIKGVAHISWIPKLTHNEAFRQVALLRIKKDLCERISNHKAWKMQTMAIRIDSFRHLAPIEAAEKQGWKLIAINLPGFAGVLSHFTQAGKCFADEISDRLKVIACLEKPNHLHSEELTDILSTDDKTRLKKLFNASDSDAQIIFWSPEEDIKTAMETIEERCKMAFEGVPNETRKSFKDGSTIFERVLPGADRMYPDTDSAPISIKQEMIDQAAENLPLEVHERLSQLSTWKVPVDAYQYILRYNLMPTIESLASTHSMEPRYFALLYAHLLKSMQADKALPISPQRLSELMDFIKQHGINHEIVPAMLKILFKHPNMLFSSVLAQTGYEKHSSSEIFANIPILLSMYAKLPGKKTKNSDAELRWCMGRLRKMALGNVLMKELGIQICQYREGGDVHA